jgi:hypothetical protein
MSRIGKQPVSLPAGVEVKISGNNVVTVKGPKGELQEQISNRLKIEIKDGVLTVTPDGDDKEAREAYGLYRSLINNMVTGVTAGFEKKLQLGGDIERRKMVRSWSFIWDSLILLRWKIRKEFRQKLPEMKLLSEALTKLW